MKTSEAVKLVLILFVVLLSAINIYGQTDSLIQVDSSQNKYRNKFKEKKQVVVSTNPSEYEIAGLFSNTGKGQLDLFEVIPAIAQQGDGAIAALDKLVNLDADDLASDSLLLGSIDDSQKNIDTFGNIGNKPNQKTMDDERIKKQLKKNYLFSIMVLESIKSDSSIKVLMKIAANNKDSDAKGHALNYLAQTYYYKCTEKEMKPNKEAVKILISSTDDTTGVKYLEMSLGQIAREGIKNWLGEDWGDVQKDLVVRNNNKGKSTMKDEKDETITEYRLKWWNDNKGFYKWDGNLGRFIN